MYSQYNNNKKKNLKPPLNRDYQTQHRTQHFHHLRKFYRRALIKAKAMDELMMEGSRKEKGEIKETILINTNFKE
jgi:hypothetical protein